MSDSLIEMYNLFVRYGGIIAFPLMFIENIPFVGFVVPGVVLLIVLGFIYSQSAEIFILTMFLAYTGILSGDFLWFMIGRLSSGKWKALKDVNSRSRTLMQVIKNQPSVFLLFYQFPPYFRMFLPFSMGVAHYSVRRWLYVSSVATFIFVVTIGGVGYLAGHFFSSRVTADDIATTFSALIAVYALLYLIKLTHQYIKLRKLHSQ